MCEFIINGIEFDSDFYMGQKCSKSCPRKILQKAVTFIFRFDCLEQFSNAIFSKTPYSVDTTFLYTHDDYSLEARRYTKCWLHYSR